MSDKLYEAFRIYLKEGLLGLDYSSAIKLLVSKGYDEQRINEARDAYTKVTDDKVLKTLISELSSYDLNYISIKELYANRMREMGITPASENSVKTPPVVEDTKEAPAEEKNVDKLPEVKDPTLSLAEDMTRYNNILQTQQVLTTQEPKKIDEVQNNSQQLPTSPIQKEKTKDLTLEKQNVINGYGYANIVLMSIIVMIIVAIICVFIFVK